MKKAIKIIFPICLLCVVILLACNKKIDEEVIKSQKEQQASGSISSDQSRSVPTSGITVSSRDFLVFEKVENFADFHDFLINSSHAEVQEYLEGLSFHSTGASLYEPSSETVTEPQTIDYMFGSDKVVEIEGVVMKLTSDNKFLLTMVESKVDNITYAELVSESYNSSTMNRFSTFPEEDGPLLIPFINETPTGYNETTEYVASGTVFGCRDKSQVLTPTYNYNGVGQCTKYVHTNHWTDCYFFGIRIKRSDIWGSTSETAEPNSNFCN